MSSETQNKTDACKVLNALLPYLNMWSHFNTKQELANGILSELDRLGIKGFRWDRLQHQFREGEWT